jgi:hypothetical protein
VTVRNSLKTLVMLGALLGLSSFGSARAQDWTDYLHWPYVPPQVPGNGFEYRSLYDRFYLYPREQRIVPQIQGHMYHNFYGGRRNQNMFHPWNPRTLNNMKYYKGYHYTLDVF